MCFVHYNFIPTLSGWLSLESERQQVSFGLQESSPCPIWSQIIIIIIIITLCKFVFFFFFFALALSCVLPLESERQQVSSGFHDSSQYSIRSQQCCCQDGLDSPLIFNSSSPFFRFLETHPSTPVSPSPSSSTTFLVIRKRSTYTSSF